MAAAGWCEAWSGRLICEKPTVGARWGVGGTGATPFSCVWHGTGTTIRACVLAMSPRSHSYMFPSFTYYFRPLHPISLGPTRTPFRAPAFPARIHVSGAEHAKHSTCV